MKNNYKNSKYLIWLYNVNSREYMIISQYLPEEHFEIIDIGNDYTNFNNLKNKHILEKPDIVITDSKNSIDSNIIAILYESHCGLAKVTTQKVEHILGNTFELSDDEMEETKNGKSYKITKTQKSINKIIDICQLSNIEKLQRITNIQAKQTYNTIDINQALDEGKGFDYISKEYLFKLSKTLNEFISLKDNYTAGHCERVANYSEALGHALNMNNEQIEDLILAANLHDIGKIALPDAVITKTSKLNDLEFNLMKKHVELGSLLLPGNQLGYLKDAVRAHHEKYDGSGYPDGLKGNQIPLFAQILAIADSFDAMTSQRSYNKVKSATEAFEDLKRHTKPYGVEDGLGMFYNPTLVDKFIKVISESKTTMETLNNAKIQADMNANYKEQQDQLQKEKEIQLLKKGDNKNV